jgi:hypothetical protein
MKSKILQKGVAIFLAIMITSILLAIGLGLTVIIISQVKLMNNIGDSVVALYAADTGIEHSLYNKRIEEEGSGVFSDDQPIGPAVYIVSYFYDVNTDEGYWTSTGTFKGSKRSIEVGTFAALPASYRTYKLACLGDCGDPEDNCNGGWSCPLSKAFSQLTLDACTGFKCQRKFYRDPDTGETIYYCLPPVNPCIYVCDEGYIYSSISKECVEL